MNLLRSILFDNLGLKLVALLLAVLVYLNVYTDRPATMIISFPVQVTDLADTLVIAGPVPPAVQVELRGTAKQLIRLRLTEPPLKLSLAGVGQGHYERALGPTDLPLPDVPSLQVERMVTPRTLSLDVDRKIRRRLPVAARVQGEPAGGYLWPGRVEVEPGVVDVTGPQKSIAVLDSVRLRAVPLGGRRDTLNVLAGPQGLPLGATIEPEAVTVTIPVEPTITRRFAVPVVAPHPAPGLVADPGHVTAVVVVPKSRYRPEVVSKLRAVWSIASSAEREGGRAGLRRGGSLPPGSRVRFDPDTVTLRRARS